MNFIDTSVGSLEPTTAWSGQRAGARRARTVNTHALDTRAVKDDDTAELTPEALFVSEIVQLNERGQIDEALRSIYRWINMQFTMGAFGSCSAVLRSFARERLSADVIVGLLGATRVAAPQLGSRRSDFVEQARRQMIPEIGRERTERILSRLG